MFLSDMYFYKDEHIEILYIGKMNNRFWPWHMHPDVYQIVLLIEGELDIQFRSHVSRMKTDDVMVIPPYAAHVEKSEDPIEVMCLCVKKEIVAADGVALLDFFDDVTIKLLQLGVLNKKHLIKMCIAASQVLYLYQQRPGICAEHIAVIREQLETQPESRITMDEMSTLFNRSRDQLIREFQKHVGLTPHQYQIQNRVKKASQLLAQTNFTTNEIAVATGFCDKGHLRRNFKYLLGMTPHDYREAYQAALPLWQFKTEDERKNDRDLGVALHM